MASLFIIYLMFYLFWISYSGKTIQISTKLGRIRGNIRTHEPTNSSIYEFLGIQYGIAPIGNLRFRPAQLNESWSNATYPATQYGAACIQNNAFGENYQKQDEDCLFLNIWTPTASKDANLNIMVWIHGGGFVVGDSSSFEYNPINFIAESGLNIIVISINYRLGPLGFLSSEQLYAEDTNWASYGGMNGIYDQIQALNWINKYISDFGGNKDNITIFGQSAGGVSACCLIVSPMVPNNSFSGSIVQSGSCIGPWGPQPKDIAIEYSKERLLRAGYSTNITKLRQVNATKFVLDILGDADVWPPGVDQLVLTEIPQITYKDIDRHKVNGNSMMIGFTSMDGIMGFPYYIGPHPMNAVEYNEYLSLYVANKTQVTLLQNYYYPLSDFPEYDNNTNASIAWYTINGDVCVVCPSLQQTMNIRNSDKFEAFVYQFRGPKYPFFAPHASELSFIFDHQNETGQYDVVWSQLLSNEMVSAWSNYGLYGIPNINDRMDNIEIKWTPFGDEENVMIFDDNVRIESQFYKTYRNGVCSFWFSEIGLTTMTEFCVNVKTLKINLNV